MCFGTGQPRKYGINPEDDLPSTRLRRDVERHLQHAPNPYPRPSTGRRYPKVYRNEGEQFDNIELFEYPDEAYGYGEHQNARGKQKIYLPDGRIRTQSPGRVRAVTDRNRNLQGTTFHPRRDNGYHQRSDEIYGYGPFQQTYRYGNHGERWRVR